MSIWTSDPARARTMTVRALALGLILPLAGCLSEEFGSLGGQASDAPEGEPDVVLDDVSLYNGRVVVAPPRGYCIDRRAVKRGMGNSFVLLASCEVLTATRGIAVEPGLITVTVLARRSDGSQPTAAEMAAPLAPAETLDQIDGDGVALVHVAQGGDQVLPGGDPRHWRAGMVLNGHPVGLAVYGRAGGGLAGSRGKRLIVDVAEALREASPAPIQAPATRAAQPVAEAPEKTPEKVE